MRNLHRRFVLCSNGQIYGGDFAKFCGLLRIYELYIKLIQGMIATYWVIVIRYHFRIFQQLLHQMVAYLTFIALSQLKLAFRLSVVTAHLLKINEIFKMHC